MPAGPTNQANLKKLVEEQESIARKGDGGKSSVRPIDFWWDQFVNYIATIMALGILLDSFLQQLLGTGGPVCILPASRINSSFEISRDDMVYINTFCEQSLSRAENYPLFVLVQGILLATPHFVWSALYVADFDYFFSVVQNLNRFRDRKTGQYKAENFYIVNKLEEKYRGRYGIFLVYIVKIFIQCLIGIGAILMNQLYFKDKYFEFNFTCTGPCTMCDKWSYSFPSVRCVISSFRVYYTLKYVNLTLLILALCMLGCGILWCYMRYTKAQDHKKVAKFATELCLDTKYYEPKPFWKCMRLNPQTKHDFHWLRRGLRRGLQCRGLCHGLHRVLRRADDLHFLKMRLFRADSGHGSVFMSLQVEKEISKRIERGYYEQEEQQSSMLNQIAMEIRFGPGWYSLKLEKKYKKVLSIHFDPFYENEPKKGGYQKLCTIHLQGNYLTQCKDYQMECKRLVHSEFPVIFDKHLVQKDFVDLVLVAPLTDLSESESARRFLESTAGFILAKGCTIVYLRPQIAHKHQFVDLNLKKEESFERSCVDDTIRNFLEGALGGSSKGDVLTVDNEVEWKFHISVFTVVKPVT